MSKDNAKKYNHKLVEDKWQKKWQQDKLYHPDLNATNKFYNLWMFPYPSGEGLHAGHAFTTTGSDIYGRFQRMNEKTVFQPTGFDSFGIHAENYSLKINKAPQEMLKKTIARYTEQLKSLGQGYDWDRTVTTSDVDYYVWTQWLFIELFKSGLAYRREATVNWCPSCKTVLADEQVINEECERCGTKVEKKDLKQWFFRITDYADRLLNNLKKIDWSERVVKAQTNWIGKKEGINITYDIKGFNDPITCWTSRPDTNFGATFIVIAPEHTLAQKLATGEQGEAVEKYIKKSQNISKEDRIKEGRKKTGVFTGRYAINKLNGAEMPIYIADFVLPGVGTGAVVGVPGHDLRDFEFAQQFDLPVKIVVQQTTKFARSFLMGGKDISDKELKKLNIEIAEKDKDGDRKLEIPVSSLKAYKELIKSKLEPGFWNDIVGDDIWFLFKDKDNKTDEYVLNDNNKTEIAQRCSDITNDPIEKTSNIYLYLASNSWYTPVLIQEKEGKMVNSEFLDGLDITKATEKMMDYLEEKGWGKRVSNYHLRDWLISRQRYWGPPIPTIHCDHCAKENKSWFTQNQPDLHSDQSDWDHAGWYPATDLPVKLPELSDYQPKGEGSGPLADHPEFYETTCPSCGQPAKRETDVSDTFLDSSWYFLAYPNVDSEEYKNGPSLSDQHSTPLNAKLSKHWLPVDLYFGGAEHSVLHLMYARFITQVLYDLKYINFEEPFPRFYAHGLMIKDGAKMSKSKGNVVNPDEYIEKYGADTLRLYLVFMGPMDGYPDFRDTGIEGMKRFVDKLWHLFNSSQSDEVTEKSIILHQTIKKVTEDVQNFRYNTAISSIMVLVNHLQSNPKAVNHQSLAILCQLIAPFAPHLAEEVWVNILGEKYSVHKSFWPNYDPKLLVEDTVSIPIQVNGKLRATLEVPLNLSNSDLESKALALPKVKTYVQKGKIIKVIIVKNKIINLIVK